MTPSQSKMRAFSNEPGVEWRDVVERTECDETKAGPVVEREGDDTKAETVVVAMSAAISSGVREEPQFIVIVVVVDLCLCEKGSVWLLHDVTHCVVAVRDVSKRIQQSTSSVCFLPFWRVARIFRFVVATTCRCLVSSPAAVPTCPVHSHLIVIITTCQDHL